MATTSAGGYKPCSQPVDEESVVELIRGDPNAMKKYKYFKMSKDSKDRARECSKCSTALLGNGPDDPLVECNVCGHRFCFVHGDKHDPSIKSCEEYVRENAHELKEEKLSRF